ncbi:large conductance mechanosensitive channel protein MscL [Paenibacillus psychroresistens]|uniref:Large-conductance mechanosensitive channel n=1 Tax=Paenibacillus psychroresistens TaxID=1778678 RepID=A0A6B8RLD1_9BACL|nr:large conductance mechanosensitive channel protein MscL [Paenibacillus psychroresistens]QGQ96325.1 large conductance mechanosensitive channel protein MscL [Paenibacillus psychroresistens]
MLKDFKSFAFKGNMVDLAVGVIIGAAFSKVITSIVNDLIMPFLGLLLGSVNFADLFISLDGRHFKNIDEAVKASAPILYYGKFMSTFLDFIIVAFVIFMVVRQLARFKKKVEAAPINTKECPQCLSEIPLKANRCKFCTSEVEALTS